MRAPTNRYRIETGRALIRAYRQRASLSASEGRQEYTVTDAVTDLLHYARSRGFDVEYICSCAFDHLDAEAIEHCLRCGRLVVREAAIADSSTRSITAYYCSEACKEGSIKGSGPAST